MYVYPEWLVQSNIDRFRDEESRKEIEAYNSAPDNAKPVDKQKRPSFLQKLRRPSGPRRGSATDIPTGPPQRISKAYVRMTVDPPSFPYHRDRAGGIVEFVDWMGGLWKSKGSSEITVTIYDSNPSSSEGKGGTSAGSDVTLGAIEVEVNTEK